ncbi:hypothetical protein E8E01_00390 [Methylorubrum populi]|uniref:hypothetical protein n=1 Tax=Methylorubrum populi TaxID=223967 RepID=UPI0011500D55|nr:hypothetical protein [Methylorubrum populi]QDI79014.1 hypothetical protein E8E01_00390 [Methylorubrum populi]
MSVTSHLSMDIASKAAMFGVATARGIDRAFANAADRRAVAAHANAGLADRLQSAREGERDALVAAHQLALELARVRAENAALRAALEAERAQSIRLALVIRQVAAAA